MLADFEGGRETEGRDAGEDEVEEGSVMLCGEAVCAR